MAIDYHRLTDVIDRAPVTANGPTFEATANVGEGLRSNLTVDVVAPLDRLSIPGGRLTLGVNLLVASEFTDAFTGQKRRFSNVGDYRLNFRSIRR